MISKPILKFNSPTFKIFVNSRPVEDRIIKKAILNAYSRWIQPGTYPLAIIFLNMPTRKVDVNVHPRKKEVKFQDPGSIFNMIYQIIKDHIMKKDDIENKISSAGSTFLHKAKGKAKDEAKGYG